MKKSCSFWRRWPEDVGCWSERFHRWATWKCSLVGTVLR